MFKFNFNRESCLNDDKKDDLNYHEDDSFIQKETIECGVFELLNDNHQEEEEITFKQINLSNDISIKCISSIKSKFSKDLNEINKTHDVVPGKYEGGLKIWESSIDLAKYLIENKLKFNRKINILELGCGHGLPVLALLKIIPHEYINSIYLQDFNKECLEKITCPNISHALSDIKINIKFIYGDWKHLLSENLIPSNYFDLILTSETIYNNLYYKSLLNLMKYSLNIKEKDSFILLAAKTYYFGCKGNIHDFCNLAKSNEYLFKLSDNLLVNNNNEMPFNKDQMSISREIIKMYFYF